MRNTESQLIAEWREFAGFTAAEQRYIAARLAAHRPTPTPPNLAALIQISGQDIAKVALTGFPAYRFLYERLFGPEVRPWLPAAFCAAAALPHLPPARRLALLHSLSEAVVTAPEWSDAAPQFYPAAHVERSRDTSPTSPNILRLRSG